MKEQDVSAWVVLAATSVPVDMMLVAALTRECRMETLIAGVWTTAVMCVAVFKTYKATFGYRIDEQHREQFLPPQILSSDTPRDEHKDVE